MATRYETGQIYGLFVLATGAARIHVTGVISPRQAGTVPAPSGGTGTAARRFCEQFSAAFHARDFAQAGAMCHPDVVALLPSISGVLAGRESMLAEFRRGPRAAGLDDASPA